MIEQLIRDNAEWLEPRLASKIGAYGDPDFPEITDACAYALLGGGKRLRALLVREFCALCGGSDREALPFMCAVEMVHAYSLVHDDLPCMDDDELRRGRPTCHVKFGEALALLAGDALLTHAFDTAAASPLPDAAVREAVLLLARGAGIGGMLGGQVMDIAPSPVDRARLDRLQARKTGALIECSAALGALCGNFSSAAEKDEAVQAAREYAREFGRAFQIVDDLLGAVGDAGTLGKPVGSDERNGKVTFVSEYGVEGARALAREHTERAIAALERFGAGCDTLRGLARWQTEREM